MIKLAVNMIVFNSDFVLKQCLESIYPFAYQILIVEGPVNYWQQQGYTTSADNTNKILHTFPDPEKKIKIVHGQYQEKNEQANGAIQHLQPECDYLLNLDSDEIYKPQDMKTVLNLLEKEKYTSVAFKSCTFYGGFTHKLTGFEENVEFLRIHKIYPGSIWLSHRPPQVKHFIPVEQQYPQKHLNMNILANMGIRMYHYSYVFPRQVKEKVQYYKSAVSQDNCIVHYFADVYTSWTLGSSKMREIIEQHYKGVHEFKPEFRGPCRTEFFQGDHPATIKRDMLQLKQRFNEELQKYCIQQGRQHGKNLLV